MTPHIIVIHTSSVYLKLMTCSQWLGIIDQSFIRANAIKTRSSATAEIARVGGHYAVQGHSTPLISILIENPYATSY